MKLALVLLPVVLLSVPACSSRNWFASMQDNARLQCQKTPDLDAARRCEEEINRRKYDDYERERPK